MKRLACRSTSSFAVLALLASVAVTSAAGCGLDSLGWSETVTQTSQLFSPPAIEDDKLSDKHPVLDPTLSTAETIDHCNFTVNKSGSITKLDLPGYSPADAPLQNQLFHNYADAAKQLPGKDILPSMEVIEAAQKPFDDGLYAAVERAAEDGSSASPINKKKLFDAVLAQLVTTAQSGSSSEQPYAKEAAAQLAAAVKLGGGTPVAPSDVLGKADALIATFNADPIASKPIGFYTWSSDLGRIFQRDRFLQSWPAVAPTFGAFAASAHAIDGSGNAANYGKVLDLYAGMTDAYFHRPLTDLLPDASAPGAFDNLSTLHSSFVAAHPDFAKTPSTCAARLAFLPPSESPDERVFRQQFCGTTLPPGTNLLDVLVNLIRSGSVDLTPHKGSGWASQQMWALATLLAPETAPEKDHLFLTAAYKKKLIETFKTILIENRETHAKQDEIGGALTSIEIPNVDVYPVLPIEPFPTYYLRTARGYRFVQALLTSVMGPDFLKNAHRVIEDGTQSPLSLGDELSQIILRDYGFYAIASDAIGFAPQLSPGEDVGIDLAAARDAARKWVAGWQTDADVGRDPRVIVPEFIDQDHGVAHYWAMVGVRALPMKASFVAGFEPKVATPSCTTGKFVSHDYMLLVGKTLDVSIPLSKSPPTRTEFRALCDAQGTADAIASALAKP